MNDVKVFEINEGTKIQWAQTWSKITFGDDELMVNVEKYQRDWPVHLDICGDSDGNLVIGAGTGRYYVAQIDISATQYTQIQTAYNAEEDTPQYISEPAPFDMADVTLTLWSVDGLRGGN